MTDKYYLTTINHNPFFFKGSIRPHMFYPWIPRVSAKVNEMVQGGWDIYISGEYFDKKGCTQVKNKSDWVKTDDVVEITEEQYNMFKKEVLKINKLKEMFHTTALALIKSKTDASRTDKKRSD